ncbi:MAG: TA system VapC family ribonuclease toxin [Mycobacterium sp.]
MTTLLDANVLVALIVTDHIHHEPAENWFAGLDDSFATCPITQGSLVRFLMRQGHSADGTQAVVAALTGNARHEFWPDSVSFTDVALRGVIGHRQVTDAYLAQLARTNGGTLATFDRGLVALHSDVAALVPTAP